MKKLAWLTILGVSLCILNSDLAKALVIEGAIEEDVELAEFIATIEIKTLEVKQEGSIYTYVTFDVIEVIKGDPKELPKTIRLRGGSIGGISEIVSDIPELQVGERYLVFLRFDNPSCPIIGGHVRTFKVKHDDRLGKEMVWSYQNEKIYGFGKNGRVLKKMSQVQETEWDIGRFREHLKDIMKRKDYRDRSKER